MSESFQRFLDALDEYNEARAALSSARSEYSGYSPDYFLRDHVERCEVLAQSLQDAFNAAVLDAVAQGREGNG